MTSVLTLELAEPFRIVVENRLNTISPYTLLEQETWFESEVPLFRAFLKPGMRVVDIGANCGFYTLLAAERVGAQGHVWSFEPALIPKRLLKESLKLNDFGNVTLYEAAAGPAPGTIWFADHDNSEMSAVVPAGTPGARAVAVQSLDHLHIEGTLRGIDLVKIDAEGFEDQVIAGATAFFAGEDPLVMLEVVAGTAGADMGAAERLQAMGYQFYRYNPAIGCLAPLVIGKIGDVLLNIFLCKPERAARLRQAGLLVTQDDLADAPYEPASPALFPDWFSRLPVTSACPAPAPPQSEDTEAYYAMCAELLLSEDTGLPVAERMVRLRRAESWIDTRYRNGMPPAIIVSMLRVLVGCGRISIVAGLIDMIGGGQSLTPETILYPFLPVSPRWDAMPAQDGAFTAWLMAMLAEERELNRSMSSFFESSGTLAACQTTHLCGYPDEALERRAALAALIGKGDTLAEPVFIAGAVARNRTIWNEIAARLARGDRGVMALDAGWELVD